MGSDVQLLSPRDWGNRGYVGTWFVGNSGGSSSSPRPPKADDLNALRVEAENPAPSMWESPKRFFALLSTKRVSSWAGTNTSGPQLLPRVLTTTAIKRLFLNVPPAHPRLSLARKAIPVPGFRFRSLLPRRSTFTSGGLLGLHVAILPHVQLQLHLAGVR